MPFAAALSEHPLATHATGEVVGSLLEQIGPEPDVTVVFVTGPHLGALDDICAAVRATLAPRALIGATVVSLVGGSREVEEQAAISVWAGRLADAAAVRLEARPLVEGDTDADVDGQLDGSDPDLRVGFIGLPEEAGRPGSTLLLVADPGTFPTEAFLEAAARQLPGLTVVGGLASGPAAHGANRLAVDDRVHTDGAVGLLLGPEWPVTTFVSQGCRPIGDPFTVTRAERSMVYEIAGASALSKLQEVVEAAPPRDRVLVRTQLQLGRVVDLRAREPDRGDFLIRRSGARIPTSAPWRSPTRSTSAPLCSSRCRTPIPLTRTCGCCWPTRWRRPPSSSRATGGACSSSANRTTTPRW